MNNRLINKVARIIMAGYLDEYYTSEFGCEQESFEIDFLKINGEQLNKDEKYSIFINVCGHATGQAYQEIHDELEYSNREYLVDELEREVDYDFSDIIIYKGNANDAIINDDEKVDLKENDYIEIKFNHDSFSGIYKDVKTKILQKYVQMITFDDWGSI